MSRAAHMDPAAFASGAVVYPPVERLPHRDSRYALTDEHGDFTEHGWDMFSDAVADAAADHEGDE